MMSSQSIMISNGAFRRLGCTPVYSKCVTTLLSLDPTSQLDCDDCDVKSGHDRDQ